MVKCFRGFDFPIFEYCSAVWCSDAHTPNRLSDRVISGASFLSGGVLECNLFHRGIFDPLRFCLCCISSRVIQCIYILVRCLCLLCQVGVQVVSWSLICFLMHLLAVKSFTTAWHLYLTQYFIERSLNSMSVGVGPASFKRKVNASLLDWAAFSFVFHCFLSHSPVLLWVDFAHGVGRILQARRISRHTD